MGCYGLAENSKRTESPRPGTRGASQNNSMPKQTRLFVACIISLVAVAIGFVVRAFLITEWGITFNLSETQIGSIQGAGLYPQALSIILFSLVFDLVGYGRIMACAWIWH